MRINGNTGVVDFNGVSREVSFDLLDNPVLGSYVLVHAGYAIKTVDESKARFTIDFFSGRLDGK